MAVHACCRPTPWENTTQAASEDLRGRMSGQQEKKSGGGIFKSHDITPSRSSCSVVQDWPNQIPRCTPTRINSQYARGNMLQDPAAANIDAVEGAVDGHEDLGEHGFESNGSERGGDGNIACERPGAIGWDGPRCHTHNARQHDAHPKEFVHEAFGHFRPGSARKKIETEKRQQTLF